MKKALLTTSVLIAFEVALPVTAAKAQSEPPAEAAQTTESATNDANEIVVTGTLLRGVAPTGTNVIGVSSRDIQETGATTTAQLLQTIPQLGSFGGLQYPISSGNTVTVNRPNLRNLPGFNTAGGSTTLVLLDGHRMVGTGVTSTTPDPDVIPPGAIERLEIVPDGGSAVYGSDAVAGVLNFITRKRFDGVKVDAHYGFASNYYQWDGSVTAGRDWGSGSLYVSYNYSQHDEIFGRDRSYIKQFPDAITGRLNIQCNPGTVQIGTTVYALPFTSATAVAGTSNQCDVSNDAVFYPSEHRHSVLAGLYQELNDSLTLEVKGFYSNRKLLSTLGSLVQTSSVTAASPYFASHRIGAETSQNVNYTIGGLDAHRQPVSLATWGITPTLTAKLGGDWQARLMGNVGESETDSHETTANTTALGNAINAGFFNPYSPYDTSSPNYAAALAAITNFETYGHSKQFMSNVRLVADGSLFHLPGGAVKLAVGGEFYHENYQVRLGSAVPGTAASGYGGMSIGATPIIAAVAPLTLRQLSRNVKSVFGELVVPIFGADNATTMFQELTLSASGRYDDYSDFGHTFNPKFGITWKPVNGLKLRGSYGESFNAPSLADAPSMDLTSVFLVPSGLPTGSLLVTNGGAYPVPTGLQIARVSVRGNAPGIVPQTAKTISAGFDFTPFDGVAISATYYNMRLSNVISIPPGQNTALVFRDYGSAVRVNDGSAAFSQAVVDLINSASPGALFNIGVPCSTANPVSCVPYTYAITDIRKQNLGDFHLSGIDFNIDVSRPTGFGTVNFGFKGTYELTRKQKSSPASAAFVDLLGANNSRFFFQASAGVDIGKLMAQAILSHRAGYKLDPVVGLVPQTTVGSYNVVDVFFRYDPKGEGLFKDLQFTLNVNNVFDQAPPEFRGAQSPTTGTINGMTIGRLVQFGVSKKF